MRYRKKLDNKKTKLLLTIFLALVMITYITTYTLTYSEYTTTTTLSKVENASGVFGNVVVVDDFLNDYNYYMGLNYTSSADGKLPSNNNQNIYNDSNLVKVTIHYSGIDINNDSLVGYVSLDEKQDIYTYYKYYPVKDGYVNIELIDNPFTDRPIDKGFNGWITNYPGAILSYDDTYYTRYVKVPVTMIESIPEPIEIIMNASWITAKVGKITSTNNQWINVFNTLNRKTMWQASGVVYEDVTQFYTSGMVARKESYPDGAVNINGNNLSGNCNNKNGCSYYLQVAENIYDNTETYYELVNQNMVEHVVSVIDSELEVGDKASGFYRRVIVNYGSSYVGYYDNFGVYQQNGVCNTYGGCSFYELVQYYDNLGKIEEVTDDNTYFYLATRDTNIVVMQANTSSSWTSDQNKPFTLTGVHNDTDYRNNVVWNVTNTSIKCYNDTAIENLQINSGQVANDNDPSALETATRYLYGNYQNVKVGRGIIRNNTMQTLNGVIGGDNNGRARGDVNNLLKYKLSVESGFYNNIVLTNGPVTGNNDKYVEARGTYGNDYDKVTENNSNLDVSYDVAGSWGGGDYFSSSVETGVTFDTIVHSGNFGSGKYDHTTGIYIGGRSYGTHYTARRIKIEGGWIYNLIGGPLTANNRTNINDTYVYMTGGAVDMIVGGAGTSATYGNRIISITGGIVNYSVFGGSNGYAGSGSDGTLNGSSLVYVGGNAVIGNKENVDNNTLLWGVEAGSVFGIGNGRAGTSSIGSNDNSNIILDADATILNNVYGGGNYGATGISSISSSNKTTITINGGNVNGSVYGGGNNNGAGSTVKTSLINIEMNNGIILGSIYGGSKNRGIVYGNVNLNILGGTVTNSVYGGGEGGYLSDTEPGTFVTGMVDVKVGNLNDDNSRLMIMDSVYGGSAYGTVNGSTQTTNLSPNNTHVIVNAGEIKNVFGGGEGNDVYTPYVEGNVTVDVHGGIIENVFGGNDLKGTPNGKVIVNVHNGIVKNAYAGGNKTEVESPYINLLGGTIENAFGGGNNAKVTTSNVLLDGSAVTNVFGGSNASGDVATSNLIAKSGKATNLFGGNNVGGTTEVTNVTIDGGEIENAYGGGEKTDVTGSTNITLNSKVVNLFGGSDSAGTVTTSYVNVQTGIATNVYGGNNLGGTTTTTNVAITGGIIENVYGGGLQANTNSTNVNFIYGKVTNLFGGGSKAGVDNTHVNLNKGYALNVFGGSNTSGDVDNSNIKNIDSTLETSGLNVATTITPSSNNQTGTSDMLSSETITATITNTTGANITKWDLYLITSKAVFDSNWSSANVVEDNGVFHIDEVNQWYGTNSIANGGSYQFNFNIHAYVAYDEFKVYGYMITGYDDAGGKYKTVIFDEMYVTNMFGGNNEGGKTKVSNIQLTKGIVDSVYGGGEKATTDETHVDIGGATIKKVVYGGGDQAPITTNTEVSLHSNANVLGTVYGGGNAGVVNGETNVSVNKSIVKDVFGGGNKAKVMGDAIVNIDAATISNNVYGGGNEADIEGNTSVKVVGTNVSYNVFGGGNNGRVYKDATTTITNASIGESAYAGGNGTTAIVVGNNLINIEGVTSIVKHVFGGGNAAATGCDTDIVDTDGNVILACANKNASKSEVNIAGATIGGNVYGGANTSVVYGETFVNIGIDAIRADYNLNQGNVTITGTVFGGGEANAAGSEDYDFNFISVTKGINIHIDAKGHDDFDIGGSIFGSGNASSSGGYSYINIDNYGNVADYKNNISIQRADVVVLNNSVIELEGAKDRTNKYDTELFTLSRIKELKLKNNSVLYLDTGTNLLEKFSSLVDVDGKEVKEVVTIDKEKGKVTRNVDNRIYMLEGKNLNISDDESLASYGVVDGMAFFGMFTKDRTGVVATALYSPKYNYGDLVSGSELYYFSSGSYVVGQHKRDHDYYKDGFYTNYAAEDGDRIVVDYIEPTPNDAIYYRWVVGEAVEVLEVNLTASKYSTLGTQELQLLNFYHPNTRIHILGVNYDGLSSDVNLLASRDIPRHADSVDAANSNFGLAMKTGTTGWITKGETEFLTVGNKDIQGTTLYKSENSNAIPSFIFYFYHSKNLTVTRKLGTVTISLVVETPIDDLNNKVQRINIEVNLDSALYDGDNYEAAITPGDNYKMFANSNVHITTNSTFSTYYSLYSVSDASIYKDGYYRSLVSSYALPENTKITMIDFGSSEKPEYYYYVINKADYDASVLELSTEGEASYRLSRFVRMGSSSLDNTYNDQEANLKYYDETQKKAEEEFIFIVDLKSSNIDQDVLKKSLLIELRNANNNPVIPVLDVVQQKMVYNLYTNKEAVIDASAVLSKKSIYVGSSVDLTVVTDFKQQLTSGNVNIIDTNFYNKKLGIKISIYNEAGELVNGASLLGTKFKYDGAVYYPRQDGTVRFNIADRVANVSSKITIDTENSNLVSGVYKLVIEPFGSSDGIYYGLTASSSIEKELIVINEIFGLSASVSDSDVIIDKDTGLTIDNNHYLEFQLSYSSGLTNPNIRVSLLRRDYTDIYSSNYKLVDLQDYVTTELTKTDVEFLYLVRKSPGSVFNYLLETKDNLKTGTYKVQFSLYDDNTYIGSIDKCIIIE